MSRPALIANLEASEFLRWYWLKADLIAFCRERGLPTAGSKQEITQRVAEHLAGRAVPTVRSLRRATSSMPDEFTPNTVIGPGWRCSQQLRLFFEAECGKGFRFNAALRSFIATGAGQPLSEAVRAYKASLQDGPQPIAGQFEYNRHMREFKAQHPGSSHKQAVAAWWVKRGTPGA